jgi:hypothetical protein
MAENRSLGSRCFYLSKFEVADYVGSRAAYEGLDWLSFLEAIGHVARFKEMPRASDLSAAGCSNITELADRIDAKAVTWDDFLGHLPPGRPLDPFETRLHMLLRWLFHMLDKRRRKLKADKLKTSTTATIRASAKLLRRLKDGDGRRGYQGAVIPAEKMNDPLAFPPPT